MKFDDLVNKLLNEEMRSDAEEISDVLRDYFQGGEGSREAYIDAGRALRELGLTGSEYDLENLHKALEYAKHDEPPFEFDIEGIMDQIRGPLGAYERDEHDVEDIQDTNPMRGYYGKGEY